MTPARVAVVAEYDEGGRASALAAQLQLPLITCAAALPSDCVAYLGFSNGALQLFPADAKQSGPVCVDFAAGANAHRRQSGGELIVKAIKGRSKNSLRVVDATAGLGRDSFVLATHGFELTLIERNAVIAALLKDGLDRALQSPVETIAARMQLHRGDAVPFLTALTNDRKPDVIYLDPMFSSGNGVSHRESSALVKKDMQLFRQLLEGEMIDDDQLLECARANAKLRVVVKRALKAPFFANTEPAYSLAGKAIRFDIYV